CSSQSALTSSVEKRTSARGAVYARHCAATSARTARRSSARSLGRRATSARARARTAASRALSVAARSARARPFAISAAGRGRGADQAGRAARSATEAAAATARRMATGASPRLAPMLGKVLLLAACAAALTVPAAEPASRPVRFLLAISGGGTSSLLASSDGVRFSAALASWPGTAPAPVRRGSTIYVYDSPSLSMRGLSGTVRRFAFAGGRLVAKGTSAYNVQLSSADDALRSTPGTYAPSAAVDENGAIVLLYALRYEPSTNACPVAGQACVKLRTATEVAGSDGTAFTGDPGNRVVIPFPPSDSLDPPALLKGESGWAALLRGPGGCLHLAAARELRMH